MNIVILWQFYVMHWCHISLVTAEDVQMVPVLLFYT